jgi:hypothetical protein
LDDVISERLHEGLEDLKNELATTRRELDDVKSERLHEVLEDVKNQLANTRRELDDVKSGLTILQTVYDAAQMEAKINRAKRANTMTSTSAELLDDAASVVPTLPHSLRGPSPHPVTSGSSSSTLFPLCKHHQNSPTFDRGWYNHYGSSFGKIDGPWYSHLESTLFKDHCEALADWWASFEKVGANNFNLDSTRTPANRWFNIECKACGKGCDGRYHNGVDPKTAADARDDLCKFFGVNPPSLRSALSGCHVQRKQAIGIARPPPPPPDSSLELGELC